MRIVFLGTPDFAVASLSLLVDNGYNIVGVITSPDKYGGRGRKKRIESAVKRYALEKKLRILQPANLKNTEFLEELRSLNADLQIVVAFRMLPVAVWDMPRLGTYNLHGSLLPKYRGAAPINWAIIRGEEYTGVTTFKLKHEIDTGSISFQTRINILKNDNAGSLHDRMMYIGAELILKTVRSIEDGSIQLKEQDQSEISKAPKIFHEHCAIDFQKNPYQLYNFIRGLSPYPSAWMMIDSKKCKVHSVKYSFHPHRHELGSMVTYNKKNLIAFCDQGYIEIIRLQPEGKRPMDANAFLNGINPLQSTIRFERQDV